MARIELRLTLPMVQLALYIGLILSSCPYRGTWKFWLRPNAFPPNAFVPNWIDGPVPWQEQVAEGINFPATFSELLLMPFDGWLQTAASRELVPTLSWQSTSRFSGTGSAEPLTWD
jgi:hypothetical protein